MKRIMKAIILSLALLFSGIINFVSAQDNEVNFDKVFCYRQVEKQNNVVTVTLLINTKGLEREKTLKVKEKFPAGFTCKVKEGYGSTNAATDVSILFVWSVLPANDLFYVKYELNSATPLNESVTIMGNVSFLSETGIKYVSIEQKDFTSIPAIASKIKSIPPYQPGAESAAVTQSSNITVSDVPKPVTTYIPDTTAPKPKPIVRTNIKEEPVKAQTQTTETKTPAITPIETKTEPIKAVESQTPKTETVKTESPKVIEKPAVNVSKTPAPAGFYYTVQLGASPKKLPSNYYDKYQFSQSVDELFVDNMYKYSVGKFQTLKEANNYQNSVKQKGLQCFVVAYNDGKKITVKEALAISKQ